MARRRERRKRAKELRHQLGKEAPRRVQADAFHEADRVERLAYTRRQAAEAPGLSLSTLDRRVVPAINTVRMPWGTRLIPLAELERYLTQRPSRRGRQRGRLCPGVARASRRRHWNGSDPNMPPAEAWARSRVA